jgi:hypothetical protein
MPTGTQTPSTVVVFGGLRVPRALAGLPAIRVAGPVTGTVEAAPPGGRLAVVGGDADLAAVLTALLRADRLDIEVTHVRGWRDAWRARTGSARRVPLIRDDIGTALAGAALWLPPEGAAGLHGEAVADDVVLFDGDVAGVRIEPTADPPGVRAAVLGRRPRRWVPARAVQLGTTGARVVRDGVAGPRPVRRSTFYRHTTGWLRVR